MQPDVSWKVITKLAGVSAGFSTTGRTRLTGSEEFVIELTTYANGGGYRYISSTDFRTQVGLTARTVGYEEWVDAANAGFR